MQVKWDNMNLEVEIEDIIWPSVIECVEPQRDVLQPKTSDWRVMVHCVIVYTAMTEGRLELRCRCSVNQDTNVVVRMEIPSDVGSIPAGSVNGVVSPALPAKGITPAFDSCLRAGSSVLTNRLY